MASERRAVVGADLQRRPASWYALARAHFKDRGQSEAGARILLTEDMTTAESGRVSRLELVEV
jgi:hypothetical protein